MLEYEEKKDDKPARLSPRERECITWASQGKSASDIGAIVGISRHTVSFHLENVKRKYKVRTIVQASAKRRN